MATAFLRLVLVEDRTADRKIFKEKIREIAEAFGETWRVQEFDEIEDAIRYLDHPPPGAEPHLLICDLDFSGRNGGLQLIEHAGRLKNAVPSIVISQSNNRALRTECLKLGALAFIHKVDFSEFAAASVRNLMLDVLALADSRRSLSLANDWQFVEKGSVVLGHDLMRALDSCQGLATDLESAEAGQADQKRLQLIEGLEFSKRIVRDFSDAAFIVKQEQDRTVFCIRQLVESLVGAGRDYWRRRYSKPEVPVQFENAGSCNCFSNEVRIRRAVDNILDNAVKFSVGNVAIEIVIRPYEGEDGTGYWALSIGDNGPGVPDDQLNNISKPLVRLKHTSGLPGTGFGLHSCVLLLEPDSAGLGGHPNPRFEKAPGGGLLVTLYIPRALPEHAGGH